MRRCGLHGATQPARRRAQTRPGSPPPGPAQDTGRTTPSSLPCLVSSGLEASQRQDDQGPGLPTQDRPGRCSWTFCPALGCSILAPGVGPAPARRRPGCDSASPSSPTPSSSSSRGAACFSWSRLPQLFNLTGFALNSGSGDSVPSLVRRLAVHENSVFADPGPTATQKAPVPQTACEQERKAIS